MHRRVGVEVAGASAASLKDVMIVRLAVLPYTIAMWCADQALTTSTFGKEALALRLAETA